MAIMRRSCREESV